MADLKKLTDDATAQAVLAVGRETARRAVDDLILSDEEKAERAEGKAGNTKSRRWKLLAFAAIGVFLFVGLVGMFLSYWHWFLALGVLGLGAMYAYGKVRARLAKRSASVAKAAPPRARIEGPSQVAPPPDAVAPRQAAAEARAESESRAKALAEARAVAEQEVDEELAALKARMKK